MLLTVNPFFVFFGSLCVSIFACLFVCLFVCFLRKAESVYPNQLPPQRYSLILDLNENGCTHGIKIIITAHDH